MLYIQTFFIPTGPPDIALHKNKISVDIRIIFELNFRKEKWLVLSVYKPPVQNAIYFLNSCVLSSLFLYPLKTSENRKVFQCFQGAEKRCIENEWVYWLSQIIDFYSITYKVMIGDFNLTLDNKCIRKFMDLYNLIILIKTATCFLQSFLLIFYWQNKNAHLKIQMHLTLALVFIIC